MMAGKKRPNIILILIDALRADRLCCYGYNRNTSPNICRVANSGVLFENAIASAPWTLPSQASLFTGLYPSEHGATDETLYLNDSITTLAELLEEMGFETVAYADNPWTSNSTNLMKGFRRFYGPNLASWDRPHILLHKFKKSMKGLAKFCGLNRYILDKLHLSLHKFKEVCRKGRLPTITPIEMVEKYFHEYGQTSKPFFLFVSLNNVHMPYYPDRKFMELFNLDKVHPEQLEYLQRYFREYRSIPDTLSKQQIEILNSLYDACIASVDERLASIFDILNHKLDKENTILIITSDHGEELGEHGLLGHWLCLYDTLLKVPLIIAYPLKFSNPVTITAQVQQHNLFYTILDFVGYQGSKVAQEPIKSNSFLSNLERGIPFPEYTFAEHAYPRMTLQHIRRYNPLFKNQRLECAKQAIRCNDYKYIRYGSGYEELFALESDPKEIKNVIAEQRKMGSILRDKLDKTFKAFKKIHISSHKPSDFEPGVKERLRALGYLD